jgi:cytoskeletal protein CcmA (bactofilin family)
MKDLNPQNIGDCEPHIKVKVEEPFPTTRGPDTGAVLSWFFSRCSTGESTLDDLINCFQRDIENGMSRSDALRKYRKDLYGSVPHVIRRRLGNLLKQEAYSWDDIYSQHICGTPQLLGLTEATTCDIAGSIKKGETLLYIGVGTTLAGVDSTDTVRIVCSKGIMRIDGQVVGNVNSREGVLVVSKFGEISGQIIVSSAAINGAIRGDIRATRLLEIGRSAIILGTLSTPSLFLDYGATFNSDRGVSFKRLLKVHGRLKAHQISSRRGVLVVGRNGEVQGNTRVALAIIAGTLKGNLLASKRVVLGPSALIEGDIQSPELHSSKGAVLSGNFLKTPHPAMQ